MRTFEAHFAPHANNKTPKINYFLKSVIHVYICTSTSVPTMKAHSLIPSSTNFFSSLSFTANCSLHLVCCRKLTIECRAGGSVDVNTLKCEGNCKKDTDNP